MWMEIDEARGKRDRERVGAATGASQGKRRGGGRRVREREMGRRGRDRWGTERWRETGEKERVRERGEEGEAGGEERMRGGAG